MRTWSRIVDKLYVKSDIHVQKRRHHNFLSPRSFKWALMHLLVANAIRDDQVEQNQRCFLKLHFIDPSLFFPVDIIH